ncbi:MAG: hypothetical protein ACK4YP_16275 [Myxococcota bacterium]
MSWIALLPAVLAGSAMVEGDAKPVVAMFAVPALLWMPGHGFARRFARDPLERFVVAFWISTLLAVPAVLVGAFTGSGGAGTLRRPWGSRSSAGSSGARARRGSRPPRVSAPSR